MINKVEFNTKNVNPFSGMRWTLSLYQKCSKGTAPSSAELEKAWNEGDTPEKRAMILIVLFFAGDVTGRQHNIFEGKVDKGGNSQREVFRDSIIPFIIGKTKNLTKAQRIKLLTLVMEYTVLDNIVGARVQTKKKTQKVERVIDMISVFGVSTVGEFCSWIISKGTDFQKQCLAKFLTRPRLSKRTKSAKMLPETLAIMKVRADLIEDISKSQGFLVETKGKKGQEYKVFAGYYAWRKKYNSELESVLFSSGKILTYDKEQFFKFLEIQPSDARFRVRNRVLFDETKKWKELGVWYKEWEAFKEGAQAEQRELEAKISTDGITDDTAIQLAEIKKVAKVNVGAVNFPGMFDEIVKGTVDRLKVQPFLDKVVLPYNTLVFVDDSGSMNGRWGGYDGNFSPRDFAAFMATICLTKNPDQEARGLLGLFSSTCRMFSGITETTVKPNSLLTGTTFSHPSTPFIKETDHFLTNLARVKRFLDGNTMGRMTNVRAIPDNLNQWVDGDPNKLELIQNYPVWTLISDGNFNQLTNAAASANDFMRACENYFGFRPYVILIDVASHSSQNIEQFTGIDNLMVVPPNPINIEMFLTHFKDMDVFDIYTPLNSLYESHRYDPVKNLAVKAKFK